MAETLQSNPVEATFFVEHLRFSSGDGSAAALCRACGEPVQAGQLRLGYVPCGAVLDGGEAVVRWVHAPKCIHAPDLRVRLGSDADTVAFSPAVSSAERERVLVVLGMVPAASPLRTLTALEAPLLWPRPWSYGTARLQGWAVQPILEPSAPRPALPDQGPPPSAASAVARAALLRAGRLHRERLAARYPPAPPPDGGAEAAERPRWVTDRHALSQPDRAALPDPLPASAVETGASGSRMPAQQSRALPRHRTRPRSAASAGAGAASLIRLRQVAPAERLTVTVEEPCVICREPMLSGELVRRLPCLHLFHRRCLERWLCVKASCPLDNISVDDLLAARACQLSGGRGSFGSAGGVAGAAGAAGAARAPDIAPAG